MARYDQALARRIALEDESLKLKRADPAQDDK